MTGKSKLVIGIGVLAVVAVVIAIVVGIMHTAGSDRVPDPARQTPEERIAYMATEDFGDLPVQKRGEYIEQIRDLEGDGALWRGARRAEGLSEDEQHRLRKNVGPIMRERFTDMVNDYFELPRAERTAYLDTFIDRMTERRVRRNEKRQEEADSAVPGDADSRRRGEDGRRRGPPSIARVRDRLEGVSAEERARHMEFMIALRQRMEERGIDPPRPGRGRGNR